SGRMPDRALFSVPLGVTRAAAVDSAGDETTPDVLDTSDLLYPSWLSDLSFAEVLRDVGRDAGGDAAKETVRARPFLLEGDRVVFLEAEEKASALILDLEEHDEDRLQRLAVDDIAEGMYVLLRSAGGGDYVVPVADTLL